METYKQFTTLLKDIHKDLMLGFNYGVDRESFGDHYVDGVYMYSVPSDEGDMSDTRYIFEECTFCGLDDIEQIKQRGLRRVGNKLYWVNKISDNIYKDSKPFFDFLCCYNFTDSAKSLLNYVNDTSSILFKDDDLAGYGYPSKDPIPNNKSLLPLINENGIYITQYKFDCEDHAFIIMKSDDEIIIVNYYNRLRVTHLTYYEFIGILLTIEQNNSDNRLLLSKLFDIDSTELFDAPYHVISLVNCEYYEHTASELDYKNYLQNVIKPYFVGREEEYIIDQQSKVLY